MSNIIEPKKEAVAPKLMNTIEKPKVNKIIGKRLTFLIQEVFREINTIGSKNGSAEVINQVIEMKNELEKIREQAQNII